MTKNTFRNIFMHLGITAVVVGFIAEPITQKARLILSTSFIHLTPTYAEHFDFPAGKPDGEGYYNAQGFGKNNHLGADWNGNGGGNTDLGDTI
jgi:hypothetical protein